MATNPIRSYTTISMKELKAQLFGKKKCPKCGGALVKEKYSEVKEASEIRGASMGYTHFSSSVQAKENKYRFTCKNCGSAVSLSELAEK